MKLHTVGRHHLVEGDCVEVLRAMPDACFDACVSDPPYGLGFMGKAWDSPGSMFERKANKDQKWDHIGGNHNPANSADAARTRGVEACKFQAWCEDWVTELFRTLKPGAHACLFGGTRTFHRLAVALEDAGFEIRDCLSWLYGTGFPKSLDVSKAIDAAAGATREVIGERATNKGSGGPTTYSAYGAIGQTPTLPVTSPATPEAAQWNGWGTALKPAAEMIVVVTKPLDSEGERSATLRSLETLGARLWLLSSVSAALFDSTSSPVVSSEALASARWTADELHNTWGALSALTDTWRFVSALITSSNTVTSWLNTLSGVSKLANTSTTETASSLTIDWKTLNFCASRITPRSIVQAANQAPGSWWTADPAAHALSVAVANIDSTHGRSVLDAATSSARAPRLAEVDPAVDWEPILLVRKPLIGTVAANVLAHGTGGLNIDACRIAGVKPDTTRGHGGANGRYSPIAAQGRIEDDGKGRWPANVVLDQVAAELLDVQSGETRSSDKPRNNAARTNVAKGAEKANITYGHADLGGASRFFYVAKPSRAERDRGCEALPTRSGGEATDREDDAPGTQSPRAGAGRTGGARNIHPTVKPAALIRWLVQLVTPPGGTVLDPFAGSGTIFLACEGLDVEVNAIERDPEYVQIAIARGSSAK